jgi:uncharacterized protein with PQ loop repeat
MELTQVLSWAGFVTGTLIGIPQLIKTIRSKSAGDLSATTYVLILVTCSLMLVRAVAIREMAFICYYSFLILSNLLQLFLIWRYSGQAETG